MLSLFSCLFDINFLYYTEFKKWVSISFVESHWRLDVEAVPKIVQFETLFSHQDSFNKKGRKSQTGFFRCVYIHTHMFNVIDIHILMTFTRKFLNIIKSHIIIPNVLINLKEYFSLKIFG